MLNDKYMYKKPLTKKQRKIIKTLALTRRVLSFIGETIGQSLEESIDSQRFQAAWLVGGRELVAHIKKSKQEAALRRAIQALKQRKFLEEHKRGKRLILTLTNKGKIAFLQEKLRLANAYQDGYLSLVSFDIPEQERWARSLFRRFLKDCGFKKIQKSLWATDHAVHQQLLSLIKELKIEKWVQVFLAKSIK